MGKQDRLRWRCRRGTRELDLMLMRYLDHEFPQAPPSEREAFMRFLEYPDPRLQEILLGARADVDPEIEAIVCKMKTPRSEHG